MTALRYLLDENVQGWFWAACQRHNARGMYPLDIVRVGDPSDLALGSPSRIGLLRKPRPATMSKKSGESTMPEATLEQRMTALEETVRELQEAMHARRPAPDWLDRVIGSMKDEPAFDEVLAHGRAIRRADRPAEDDAP